MATTPPAGRSIASARGRGTWKPGWARRATISDFPGKGRGCCRLHHAPRRSNVGAFEQHGRLRSVDHHDPSGTCTLFPRLKGGTLTHRDERAKWSLWVSHPLPSARQADALADELRDQNGSRRSRTLAPKGPPGFKAGLALREFTIQRIRVRGLAPPASRSRTACSTIELHPEEDGSRRTRTAAGCPANLFSRQVSSPGRVHDPRIPAEGIAPSCRPHEGRFVLDERRCGLEAYGGSRTHDFRLTKAAFCY